MLIRRGRKPFRKDRQQPPRAWQISKRFSQRIEFTSLSSMIVAYNLLHLSLLDSAVKDRSSTSEFHRTSLNLTDRLNDLWKPLNKEWSKQMAKERVREYYIVSFYSIPLSLSHAWRKIPDWVAFWSKSARNSRLSHKHIKQKYFKESRQKFGSDIKISWG